MSHKQKAVQLSGTLQPWIKSYEEPEGLKLVTTANKSYVVEHNRSGLNLLAHVGEWFVISGSVRRDGQIDYLTIRSASAAGYDFW